MRWRNRRSQKVSDWPRQVTAAGPKKLVILCNLPGENGQAQIPASGGILIGLSREIASDTGHKR